MMKKCALVSLSLFLFVSRKSLKFENLEKKSKWWRWLREDVGIRETPSRVSRLTLLKLANYGF